MEINYYLYTSKCEPCPMCGHKEEPLHIGKSSCGWCFSLHIIPELNINDLDDWVKLFDDEKNKIIDEYNTIIQKEEMLDIITKREIEEMVYDKCFFEQNHCVPGPNGLVRSELGRFCIKHGSGTWDCIIGEFS